MCLAHWRIQMRNLLVKTNKKDNLQTGESAADVNEPPSLYADAEMWVKKGDSMQMMPHRKQKKSNFKAEVFLSLICYLFNLIFFKLISLCAVEI